MGIGQATQLERLSLLTSPSKEANGLTPCQATPSSRGPSLPTRSFFYVLTFHTTSLDAPRQIPDPHPLRDTPGYRTSTSPDHALDICHCMPVSGPNPANLPSCPTRDLYIPGSPSGGLKGPKIPNQYRYRAFMTRHKRVGCRQSPTSPTKEPTQLVLRPRLGRLRTGMSRTAVGLLRATPMEIELTAPSPLSTRPLFSSPSLRGSTTLPREIPTRRRPVITMSSL